ncbi:hypothetical protein [Haliangium sp.]
MGTRRVAAGIDSHGSSRMAPCGMCNAGLECSQSNASGAYLNDTWER